MDGTLELEHHESFVEALLYKKRGKSSSTFYGAVASSHLALRQSGIV